MDYNPIYKINFCSKGISANYNILTPLKIGLNNVRCVKKKNKECLLQQKKYTPGIPDDSSLITH